MTEKVRKRRDAIINVAFLAMVLGLIFLFFKYCFGIASPFIVSFFFAVIIQKPLKWLDKKTKNKCHGLMSILLVLIHSSIFRKEFYQIESGFVEEIRFIDSSLCLVLQTYVKMKRS